MIKDVRYFYGKEQYRFNGDLFDYAVVMESTARLQKEYEQFADEINSVGGYLAIYLSHTDPECQNTRCQAFVEQIPESLELRIQQSLDQKHQ